MSVVRPVSEDLAISIVPAKRCWTPTVQLISLVAVPILAGVVGFGIGVAFVSGAAIGIAVLAGSLALLAVSNLIAWIKVPNPTEQKIADLGTEIILELTKVDDRVQLETARKLILDSKGSIDQIAGLIQEINLYEVVDEYIQLIIAAYQQNNDQILDMLLDKLATTHKPPFSFGNKNPIKHEQLLLQLVKANCITLIPRLIDKGARITVKFADHVSQLEDEPKKHKIINAVLTAQEGAYLFGKVMLEKMIRQPKDKKVYDDAFDNLKFFMSKIKENRLFHWNKLKIALGNHNALLQPDDYTKIDGDLSTLKPTEEESKVSLEGNLKEINELLNDPVCNNDVVLKSLDGFAVTPRNLLEWMQLVIKASQPIEDYYNGKLVSEENRIKVKSLTFRLMNKIPTELIVKSELLEIALQKNAISVISGMLTLHNGLGARMSRSFVQQLINHGKRQEVVKVIFNAQITKEIDQITKEKVKINAEKGIELLKQTADALVNCEDKDFKNYLTFIEELLILASQYNPKTDVTKLFNADRLKEHGRWEPIGKLLAAQNKG